MAIGAARVRNGGLEVCLPVACIAIELQMFAGKRIAGLAVIKGESRRGLLPAHRVVAGLAGLLKGAMMNIAVASGTVLKIQDNKFHNTVGGGSMALLAADQTVRPGQNEARFGVVKIACSFPIRRVVAAFATGAQLSPVFVLMTGDAGAGQAKEGAIQVSHGKSGTLRRENPLGVMALVAGQAGMLAIQHKAGLAVVEFSWRRVPVDYGEVFAVMFGVAAGAGLV